MFDPILALKKEIKELSEQIAKLSKKNKELEEHSLLRAKTSINLQKTLIYLYQQSVTLKGVITYTLREKLDMSNEEIDEMFKDAETKAKSSVEAIELQSLFDWSDSEGG
ncbi:MAG: hypothetical protein A2166_06420 [Omnitrophica WOR_2 bacterium RBG_13_41_10]|nr:MAG: hypothetical protein A2166_06420 [Omnitrophica WOR_2 bacterium RBG_13_41_10]